MKRNLNFTRAEEYYSSTTHSSTSLKSDEYWSIISSIKDSTDPNCFSSSSPYSNSISNWNYRLWPKTLRKQAFGEFSRDFRRFAKFSTFSDVLGPVQTRSDPFGCTKKSFWKKKHWTKKLTKKIRKIRTNKNRFSQISSGFWRATAKRTSKSTSTSNFPEDWLFRSSVRPLELILE